MNLEKGMLSVVFGAAAVAVGSLGALAVGVAVAPVIVPVAGIVAAGAAIIEGAAVVGYVAKTTFDDFRR